MNDAEPTVEAISEADLLAYILTKESIDREELDLLVAEQTAAYGRAQTKISGISYAIHPETRTLYIQDFLTQEVIKTLPFYTPGNEVFGEAETPQLEINTWESWGQTYCLIDPENGHIQGAIPADQDYLYGLVATAHQNLMYTYTPRQTEILGISSQCLYHRVHRDGESDTAFDLYLSENQRFLCITDRGAGKLFILSTESQEIIAQFDIRKPGSKRAINLTFDHYEDRLFITDSVSNSLLHLDLESLVLDDVSPGYGAEIYGNIVRAPDIRFVYVLVLKPAPMLQYINIENGDIEAEMPLRGDCFSQQQSDPCDLMVLTPGHKFLLLMTSNYDPAPFTPGISAMDPDTLDAIRFSTIQNALMERKKPIALVFPFKNPLMGLQKTEMELLLAAGKLTQEQVEVHRENYRQRLASKASVLAELEYVDMDAEDAPDHGQGQVPHLSPQEADNIVLPPEEAIPAIMQILSQKLYQQTDLDLGTEPEVTARFEELAESYRQTLETHDAVDVVVEIERGQTLETFISREEVLHLISAEALRRQQAPRPPTYCPSCKKPLRGQWDCNACGLELENAARRKKKAASSLSSLGALPQFHLLLADPKRQRLLILDGHKTIDWELKGEDLPCVKPWFALTLPNKRLLVCDRGSKEVFECTPGGDITWSLDQSRSLNFALNAPVKATYFSAGHEEHFLIVDQGYHRVLVVNRKQELIWEYGVQGTAGIEAGHLNGPSDIQRTYDETYLIADTGNNRVIEVRDKFIMRQFGARLGLRQPIFAQRLYDGDTLIVDAGNYRIIEVDQDGELVSECFYYTDQMEQEMCIDMPLRVYRREKRSIVLMDDDKVIEVLPIKQRLIWSSLLKHLAARIEIQRDAFDKSDSYVQSFYQYRLPTFEELMTRLRENNRLEDSSSVVQRILAQLTTLVAQRLERDRQRMETAYFKRTEGADILPVPRYIIDRTNQQVVALGAEGETLWHWGTDREYRLNRPTHVLTHGHEVFIADTNHHRILVIDSQTNTVVQSIGDKTSGELFQPRCASRTLAGNILVCDQGHKRLVEYDPDGNTVWSFNKAREISYPYSALELGNGAILFTDWALHMVKEINREGELIWAYGQPSRLGYEDNLLNCPEYAVRLPTGASLIADTGNNRVLEVSPKHEILWQFEQNKKFQLYRPNFCQRLSNGHTLIAYHTYRHLIEVDPYGDTCWYFELGTAAHIRRF